MTKLIHISGGLFTDPSNGATIDVDRLLSDYRRLQSEKSQLQAATASAIQHAPGNVQMTIGKLWWNADNLAEAQQWQAEYVAKGALLVELKPEADRAVVDVLITLHKERAKEIFGYEPEDSEWLDISEMKEQAEALGFDSIEKMVDHQQWLNQHGTPEYHAWALQVRATTNQEAK